jgi:hypothetical protein
MLGAFFVLGSTASSSLFAQGDEIVANLAGGRAIVLVTRDAILFAAIDHPPEANSIPPRVAPIDFSHIGILFGASEWQVPASPRPIRLDQNLQALARPDTHYATPEGSGEQDLEQIGVEFLEMLRPVVSQLHHRVELKPDEPLFVIVLAGFAPNNYGPEVWQVEYHVEQQQVAMQGEYWQTKLLRPRFTQLYPPSKHEPRYPVEVRYPENLPDIPLLGLLQQNDPGLARLKASDAKFAKVADAIEKGQTQKIATQDAEQYLRAVLPLLAGKNSFFLGALPEGGGLEWIVPPAEPVVKRRAAEDKDRPPDAPTLRKAPKP